MSESIRDELSRKLTGKSRDEITDELFGFMKKHGNAFYDEIVTQIDHALQCAEIAMSRGFENHAVTAALFHDIGHLLAGETQGPPEEDFVHEDVGADFLSNYFPKEVTEPIRLHVVAKRYLCLIQPDYYDGLSDGSKRSLALQGGILPESERVELEKNPLLDIAVEIRRLDDLGKIPNHTPPPIESYRDVVSSCLR